MCLTLQSACRSSTRFCLELCGSRKIPIVKSNVLFLWNEKRLKRDCRDFHLLQKGILKALFQVAHVSFLWTGKFTFIYRIFSAYRLDYIFRSIDVFFYIYLPNLICTVYLYLFPVHIIVHWNNSVYRREFLIFGSARQIYRIFSLSWVFYTYSILFAAVV